MIGNQSSEGSPIGGVGSQNHSRPFGLIAGLIVIALLLVASLIFGVWAYSQVGKYKETSDKYINTAVQKALTEQKIALDAEYAQASQSPLKTYKSPSAFGSVSISYPKTWSAYVVENTGQVSGTVVDGYFNNDFVPNVNNNNSTFSLRVQISNLSYKTATDQYQSLLNQGKLRAKPFVPDKVDSSILGVRYEGQITQNKQGAVVIVPLRDKILKIWTETTQGIKDLDAYVLNNLTFSP